MNAVWTSGRAIHDNEWFGSMDCGVDRDPQPSRRDPQDPDADESLQGATRGEEVLKFDNRSVGDARC